MHLAIINQETDIVENVVVPPQGAQVYFVSNGYYAIETETGAIGDIYANGEFNKPTEE